MTGLTPEQHYYVKAYAYNSAGYGYGNQVEFDTIIQTYTKTVSMDALLKAIDSETVDLDTYLKATDAKVVALDTLLRGLGITKTVDLDVILGAISAKSVDLDVLLKAFGVTETVELDVLLASIGIQTVDLDTILSRPSIQTVALDVILGAYPRKAAKYVLEIHQASTGDLIAILNNAHGISFSEAINEAPTLKFSLPADDKLANITKANEIWLRNYGDGSLVNRFRLTRKEGKRERGGVLVSTVYADGLINQLAEELVITYDAENLTITQIVTALCDLQVLTPRITVGRIDPDVTRSISVTNNTLLKTLYSLRDTVGGYIYVDNNRALQWRTTIGEDKGQQIRYRKNLKGITQDIDYTSLANRLYAYGAGEGDARIKLSDAEDQEEDFVEDTDSQRAYPDGWGGIYVKVLVDKSITLPAPA
ncbi:hypothetical protein ES708_25588 [subsurface metagenome]